MSSSFAFLLVFDFLRTFFFTDLFVFCVWLWGRRWGSKVNVGVIFMLFILYTFFS